MISKKIFLFLILLTTSFSAYSMEEEITPTSLEYGYIENTCPECHESSYYYEKDFLECFNLNKLEEVPVDSINYSRTICPIRNTCKHCLRYLEEKDASSDSKEDQEPEIRNKRVTNKYYHKVKRVKKLRKRNKPKTPKIHSSKK